MSIVLTRIDNRLVHGQILEAWVPFVHATCIVVANDELARTALRRMMIEASVPKSLRVVIGTIDEICQQFAGNRFAAEKVLLLFATSQDALTAHRGGIGFRELNLGNMHQGQGTYQLSCTIHLDQSDVENLRSLEDQGVEIISRCVPADRGRDWKKLIRNMPG